MNQDDFMAEFARIVAQNIEKSATMSRYMAEFIAGDRKLLEETVSRLDAEQIAKYLAQHIIRSEDYNLHARGLMASIDKRVIEITANNIAKEIMQA